MRRRAKIATADESVARNVATRLATPNQLITRVLVAGSRTYLGPSRFLTLRHPPPYSGYIYANVLIFSRISRSQQVATEVATLFHDLVFSITYGKAFGSEGRECPAGTYGWPLSPPWRLIPDPLPGRPAPPPVSPSAAIGRSRGAVLRCIPDSCPLLRAREGPRPRCATFVSWPVPGARPKTLPRGQHVSLKLWLDSLSPIPIEVRLRVSRNFMASLTRIRQVDAQKLVPKNWRHVRPAS